MPLPPPQTTAGPNAPALAALMSWLDPKPVSRTVDGVEQPLCSNGRDVVQNLQLPVAVATSLAKDIDVWLSIGRIGAVPIPETVDATTARIIMQRLRAMAPKPPSAVQPVIGTLVKEGLSKASKITHRDWHSGRVGRRKSSMQKASGPMTSSGKVIRPVNHAFHEGVGPNIPRQKGAQAIVAAYPHYTKADHREAGEHHAAQIGKQRFKTEKENLGALSAAHMDAVHLVKKSTAAALYGEVLRLHKA